MPILSSQQFFLIPVFYLPKSREAVFKGHNTFSPVPGLLSNSMQNEKRGDLFPLKDC